MAKRWHRFLGAAVLLIAAVPAAVPAAAQAPRAVRIHAGFVDLSPRAAFLDLEHAAMAGGIEGCVAGASGRLAFLIGNRNPAPASFPLTEGNDEPAFVSAGGFPNPAAPRVPGRSAAGPGPAAPAASHAVDAPVSGNGAVSGFQDSPSRLGTATASAPNLLAASPILAISDARIYPNPMNPAFTNATIEYVLSKDARVEITAYDWTGAFVDRIYAGPGTAGTNAQEWGGQTEDGQKLGNGVYLIRIVARTDARTETQVLKAVVWNDG